jgi:hypothetical protein
MHKHPTGDKPQSETSWVLLLEATLEYKTREEPQVTSVKNKQTPGCKG